MYDKLVKRLRYAASYDERIVIETCKEAADAIEEMNRRINRAIELYNRNVEKSAMYEALAGISPEWLKEEK